MKKILLAAAAALMLSGCLFEDFAFEDCECDDAYFSSPAGN